MTLRFSDVDECAEGTNYCHRLWANCSNTEEGYACVCQAGFTGDGINCVGKCFLSAQNFFSLLMHSQHLYYIHITRLAYAYFQIWCNFFQIGNTQGHWVGMHWMCDVPWTRCAMLKYWQYISIFISLWHPSPRACAVGHAGGFVVNAAQVASQWQHRAWTISLQTHPSMPSKRLDRLQVPFFKPLLPNRETNLVCQLCLRVLNQLCNFATDLAQCWGKP